MDPATILGIGGKLLGGILGNRAAKKAAAQERAMALEDQRLQWVRHREASELGGFNPLATLGLSQGVAPTPASSNNYMGEAIASSALILADNYAKTRQAAMGRQVEDLRRQRDILTRKLTANTIRPKVGGVYDNPAQFGLTANPAALSGVPDQIAERNREGAKTVGDYNAAAVVSSSPMMSAATGADQFGEAGEQAFGALNWGYALGPGTGKTLRAEFDRMGWTTPNRDYWRYWGETAWNKLKENAPKGAAPKEPNSFWSYYGAMQ